MNLNRAQHQTERPQMNFHNIKTARALFAAANQILRKHTSSEVGTARRAVRGRLGEATPPRSDLCALLAAAWLAFLPLSVLADASEQGFSAPEDATNALVLAARAQSTNAFNAIFGKAGRDLVSPDAVQAWRAFSNFTRRLSENIVLTQLSPSNIVLQIGADGWPFPIPLVGEAGVWHFDTVAGVEEILNRRVGMNELAAIRVCRAYLDAQRDYARQPRMGDDVIEYAQHLRSSTNAHDGLYWQVGPGEEPSPFGPLIAQSVEEGYHRDKKIMGENLAPYRGYCFKILTRQGSRAPAGKYNYIINGRMIAGFALVAWPEEWGNSGVMTFIVSQQGKVYEKNLGPKTSRLASSMTTYDPDETWKLAGGP